MSRLLQLVTLGYVVHYRDRTMQRSFSAIISHVYGNGVVQLHVMDYGGITVIDVVPFNENGEPGTWHLLPCTRCGSMMV